MTKSIDERINAIEEQALKLGLGSHGTAGTTISRILVDHEILIKDGVRIPTWFAELDAKTKRHNPCLLAWTIGLGGIMEPKMWCYGMTLEEALSNAEAKLDQDLALIDIERRSRKKAGSRSRRGR